MFIFDQGGKGHASNIIFERLWTQNSYNPIIIDQFYCDGEHCTEHVSNFYLQCSASDDENRLVTRLV